MVDQDAPWTILDHLGFRIPCSPAAADDSAAKVSMFDDSASRRVDALHLEEKGAGRRWKKRADVGKSTGEIGTLDVLFPRPPSTFLKDVWGGFGGSKYLLRV